MTGIHLDVVTELGERVERVEQRLGARLRFDREIGPCGVADEERVAGQNAVGDDERAVLRAMTRSVQHAHDDVAYPDLLAVPERLMRERRVGRRVNVHGQAVLEREAAVTRDVIGMRMRLEDRDQAQRLIQILLDRVGRIDDDGDAGVLITDEIGSAAEIVGQELPEVHVADASNECGYIS